MRILRVITEKNRAELMRAVELAPLGAYFQLIDAPRTLAQNRMMWRLLTRIADQLEHCGEHWAPDDWKCAFLKAMGKKLRFMPALDGKGVVAVGYQSSKLSRAEMSDMIELMFSYGAEHGVEFDDPPARSAA